MTLEGNEHTHKTEHSWTVKFSGPDWLVSDNKASLVNIIHQFSETSRKHAYIILTQLNPTFI